MKKLKANSACCRTALTFLLLVMQGKKDLSPKLFYNVSLDGLVSSDSYYRLLMKVLDLGFVRKSCASLYSSTGQPSLDPVVFFKLCIYGYMEGISSDRKLVARASDSLEARLFLGYDLDEVLPVHSTISRTRQYFPESLYKEVFDKVLGQCVGAGLVEGSHQAIDSTLVKANASLEHMARKSSFNSPDDYLVKSLTNNEAPTLPEEQDSSDDQDSSGQLKTVHKSGSMDKKRSGKHTNKTHFSISDPDSKIARKPGFKYGLYYMNQIAVDPKHDVVTAVLGHKADSSDHHYTLPLARLAQANLDKYNLSLEEISADANYYSIENVKQLQMLGVDPFIRKPKQRNTNGVYTLSDFTYNKQEDYYQCKAGEKLLFARFEKDKNCNLYQAPTQACAGCQLREQCTSAQTGRRLRVPFEIDMIRQIEQREHTAAYRQAMHHRLAAERSFGDAKNNHTMKKVLTKGVDAAHKNFTMIAVVQNLKKLIKYATHNTKKSQLEVYASLNRLIKTPKQSLSEQWI